MKKLKPVLKQKFMNFYEGLKIKQFFYKSI